MLNQCKSVKKIEQKQGTTKVRVLMSFKENTDNSLNRRQFLKKSAAAGAGLIFAPMVMTRARANDSNDLNVVLIGAGAEGSVLMNSMLKIPGIRFKAVVDIWEKYNLRRAVRLLKKYRHDVRR